MPSPVVGSGVDVLHTVQTRKILCAMLPKIITLTFNVLERKDTQSIKLRAVYALAQVGQYGNIHPTHLR